MIDQLNQSKVPIIVFDKKLEKLKGKVLFPEKLNNLSDIFIYRMMHINNISHVLEHGITHSKSKNRNVNYHSIGDNTLINTRDKKTIKVEIRNIR